MWALYNIKFEENTEKMLTLKLVKLPWEVDFFIGTDWMRKKKHLKLYMLSTYNPVKVRLWNTKLTQNVHGTVMCEVLQLV